MASISGCFEYFTFSDRLFQVHKNTRMPIPSGIDCLIHDHIDGSIAVLERLPELYKLSGLELPKELRDYENLADLGQKVRAWYSNTLLDIPTKFSLVTGVMQNPDTLFLVGKQYVKVRYGQGIRYCEGTIAPQYHTRGDKKSKAKLTEEEAIAALIEGIKAGEKEYPEFEANVLFTIGRELIREKGRDEALRLLRVATQCDRSYVVGFGLVSGEAIYRPHEYVDLFLEADRLGMPTDPHAGEWANLPGEDPYSKEVEIRLLENVRVAVYDMKAKRISHGRPIWRDPELCGYLADNNIGVSSCPGSYLNTGLIKDVRELHLDTVLERGVPVSLNPDDDLFQYGIDDVAWMCCKAYPSLRLDKLRLNAHETKLGHRKEHKI